jgi:hypothetical protein
MNLRLAIVPVLAVLAQGCGTSNVASTNPGSNAAINPEPAEGSFSYVYYPQAEAYFSPDRSMWFWIEDDAWRFGSELPDAFKSHAGQGVNVRIDCEHPAGCHAAVAAAHPAEVGHATADNP